MSIWVCTIMHVDLIGVQFDGYGRPGNQTKASEALRRAGFADAFVGATDRGDVIAHDQSGVRGPTSILNEQAMVAMQAGVRHHVVDALTRSCFPVIFGGDCTLLLGAVPAVRDVVGTTGLLHIDGHEDTTPLDVSEDGEGANAEIGLLLGVIGRSIDSPLAESPPALALDALALLGPARRRLADAVSTCPRSPESGCGNETRTPSRRTIRRCPRCGAPRGRTESGMVVARRCRCSRPRCVPGTGPAWSS